MAIATKAKKRKKRRRVAREPAAVACPFCGEAEELFFDAGGGDAQVYTEDCAVCCRPRVVHVEPGDEPGDVRVWLERGE
jgi:transcription elongation factor Elf1